MTGPSHQVLIVGLGAISGAHLHALEQIPGAEVVAGVDSASRSAEFRGHPVPVYSHAGQAAGHHNPDVVVVATPASTHAAVCDQVAGAFPAARILVEKPAADTLEGARHIITGLGARQPVDVAYHMSFSPEVDWGLTITQANARELGRPARIWARFTDPYSDQPDAAARYGTSWIDSGINALSIVNRFTRLSDRTSLRQLEPEPLSTFEARISCGTPDHRFEALILTTWHVTDPAKTTTISYKSGASLIMDHVAVAAYLIRDDQISGHFGTDRSVPRQHRHYSALYQSWLVNGTPIASPATHMQLHDLLLKPG